MNPYLPAWEYIPDGEPRVFGDRVYVYGSHDTADSDDFCDYRLKVWSAPVDHLDQWVCHGDAFCTRTIKEHTADVDWSDAKLFAPDVVEKDGKYYLYAYIINATGCVAVSDHPEGPFTLLSQYEYNIPDHYDDGIFIDPGVFVDDDGRVYIYCGFEGSYQCELNPDNMYEVLEGTYKLDVIPVAKDTEWGFYEAASMRKVGDTYYFIYSPRVGSRLAYATSDSPTGPFTYRGYIVDNAVDYPGGNNHGSICQINGQWYIFYHRMTNGTVMSRRGCVEPIRILEDGTIPPVEMTSMGFDTQLNPYAVTPADTACVLKGGCHVTEFNAFERVVTQITDGCVLGWKYFEFGQDFGPNTMELDIRMVPRGSRGRIRVYIDEVCPQNEIGTVEFAPGDTVAAGRMEKVEGRHAVYFKVEDSHNLPEWACAPGLVRQLCDISAFVFRK